MAGEGEEGGVWPLELKFRRKNRGAGHRVVLVEEWGLIFSFWKCGGTCHNVCMEIIHKYRQLSRQAATREWRFLRSERTCWQLVAKEL